MGWALESKLGSRIMLGCKFDKMGKGKKKNFFSGAFGASICMAVAADPWQLSWPGRQAGGVGGMAYQNRGDIPPVLSCVHAAPSPN